MTDLSLHMLVFAVVGGSIALLPLILGRLIRPFQPSTEKQAVYECGEEPIGSSYIQFDIRFYVVALLFIVFDVEVVFFFPWATIFGGATQLADSQLSEVARLNLTDKLLSLPAGTTTAQTAIPMSDALLLAQTGFADLLFFFGILLVGFAYIWNRGDLDWVRAVQQERRQSGFVSSEKLNPITAGDGSANEENSVISQNESAGNHSV